MADGSVSKILSSGINRLLIVSFFIMPGMSGAETFRELKEIDDKVVVVLSSGYSLDSDMEQLLNQGCRGFIQKPFTLEALFREIASVLPGVDQGPVTPE